MTVFKQTVLTAFAVGAGQKTVIPAQAGIQVCMQPSAAFVCHKFNGILPR